MVDILLYALLAGSLLAAATGPLGSLLTWQRMAYYGDTLAHSALLGAALGLALHTDVELSVLVVCAGVAILLFALQWRSAASLDSLLGILSHTGLALGLVCLSFLRGARFDLNAFLFGDLLSVTPGDLLRLAIIVAVVLAILARLWPTLVSITAHADLAAVEGIPVQRLRLIFMLLLAATVAIAMKVVGVLLVTAMLIIPATTAGRLARSPEQCAALATGLGLLSVAAGLAGSWYWDSPGGPSIVLAAASLFALSLLAPGRRAAL